VLVWLDQVECQDVTRVGGKAANLSRLAASHPVPTGFCLTTEAYAKWALGQEANTVPDAARELLTTAYATLAARCQRAEPRVAVRSSAVGEDGQNASFAGQYETYLNLVGAEAVVGAVTRCWASARSERVLAYHRQHGQATANIPLAVLVQQLVAADMSIVAFSANPVSGDSAEVVINASWGLGESVVSGTVTPDTYVVRKSDLIVTERHIADKQRMTIIAPNGVQEVPIPRPMRRQRSLSDAQAIEVAQLARTLETHMGWPVDIECAYEGKKLYLLQCRPISTLNG
jgi:phosphoenolpyruvate synthase/pyruvate phosphate dikinase